MSLRFLILTILALTSVGAFSTVPDKTKLVARGKVLYTANCIVCHNKDPNKKGSIGPELAGTSLEVMQEKVAKGTYPQGYVPKRKSKVMKKFPHLEKDVPALHAWIEAMQKK